MKVRLALGALFALVAGFGFSAGLHTSKWIYVDPNHVIVGTSDRYVDLWHGDGDGGINFRLTSSTCAGQSWSQGIYVDRDC
jgi:hypothetical protein